MTCPQALRTQALIDGELDPVAAEEAERHLAGCADCAAARDDALALRLALRALPYRRAPDSLYAVASGSLAANERRSLGARIAGWLGGPFWAGALSGTAATAVAAAFSFLIFAVPSSQLAGDIASAYLRSLQPGRTIDVASSDRHTVKPWFAGHTGVSPPAADLAAKGFGLVGARADFLDGERSAVVVYRRGAHVIQVFAWPGRGTRLPRAASRNGLSIRFWKSGDLDFAAVSDMGEDEFSAFIRLYRGGRE
jgi:anti-sigma factor RsiW